MQQVSPSPPNTSVSIFKWFVFTLLFVFAVVRQCPHLSLSRDRVPVSSSEGKLPAADTSQNLLRRVLRTVSEGSEPGDDGRDEDEMEKVFIFRYVTDYFNRNTLKVT